MTTFGFIFVAIGLSEIVFFMALLGVGIYFLMKRKNAK